MTEPWEPDEALTAFAELDLDRAARRGYPEAVYCRGKTPEQVQLIAAALRGHGDRTLFTRASPEHAAAILGELPDAFYDVASGLLAWPPDPPDPVGGRVSAWPPARPTMPSRGRHCSPRDTSAAPPT